MEGALGVGRAGVPMEVMGLMLGDFVDEYTVRVIDVFAMPQVRRTRHKVTERARASQEPVRVGGCSYE